jgi:hypothetical protein
MKIQRIFILTLITFLFINLFFINIQNTNALSFNFGGENSNLEESYSSQTGSNSWLDNFFSNVGKASKNIFQSTFSSVSDVVGKYYFGVESAKIEVVNISDNIKIDGEDVGNVKIENLEDLNKKNYSNVDWNNILDKGKTETTSAEQEIKDKLSALDKQIKDIKSDPNKTEQVKNAEIKKLEDQKLAEEKKVQEIKKVDQASQNPSYAQNHSEGAVNNSPSANSGFGPSPDPSIYTNVPPVTAADLKNLPDLGEGNADCSNGFGVNRKGGNFNGVASAIKFDTTRICKALGERIAIISGQDSRGNASYHPVGLAIDIGHTSGVNSNKKEVLRVLSLISLGYNIGSYQPGWGSFHADIGKRDDLNSAWMTWSKSSTYADKTQYPYHPSIRDALKIMGINANYAHEIRGKFKRGEMMQKATNVIKNLNNGNLNNLLAKPQTGV